MKGALATAVLAGSLGLSLAPFQCASDPDESLRQEETAPEALWNLAERFHAEHDDDARLRTLHYLVDHYPSSRFSERARLALRGRSLETKLSPSRRTENTGESAQPEPPPD